MSQPLADSRASHSADATAMPSRRVLVVEDEDAIARGLVFNLERKGYEVALEVEGRSALQRAQDERWDLIVLDVQLPGIDGFRICQQLRLDHDRVPILILTARDQPDDIVYGLKTGADDYMVKPFDLAEFLARVESLLRRQDWGGGGTTDDPSFEVERLEFGDFWVDFKTYRAGTITGEVELPKKELEVLRVFAEKPGEVVTRRELLDRVWELPNHPNERVVDNVIVSLRKSFEVDSSDPRYILSVRGVGYRFAP
ncbi:MAG: response regulator transcription factor [Thermoanaerobaculia bacterium]|nr:response regulator transcription factor [Thermoanaerobaculia bacterium]